ncbi:hypothetical protein D7319_14940 [Streptomyces radicis]|uniref:Uncharacterized protein n=1 Tax=Streptomyces radicis TaxID=1750517 RepID=A0A3A9W657_9ACTN|nr:hypothetical protein D7319_14940 [Streptomyces radicis]RKN21843.1 hypothetical protein D7318_15895 [Streptomyces radicis]
MRALFALFPVLSLGLLAWVPALRVVVIRRRAVDWAVLALMVSLTVSEVVLISTVPTDDEGPRSALVGLYLVAFLIGATIHAAMLDDTPPAPGPYPAPRPTGYGAPHGYGYPPPAASVPVPASVPVHPAPAAPAPAVPAPAAPAPPSPTSPRMRQVASELDELGELLRKQEGR